MVAARSPALVTLTTDFGTEDSYVAEMKGVLLCEGPEDLRVVDLSHQLPAQDLMAAYLFLEAAIPRFPPGTIHVAVIDPGVGSTRRALIVQYREQIIVAPDNGITSGLVRDGAIAFEIDVSSLGLGALSATFHGRDLFAPVAARLARGLQATQIASLIDDPISLPFPKPHREGDVLVGEVIHVDHFGNLITNIGRDALGFESRASLRVRCGALELPLVSHYEAVAIGHGCALISSHGLLEIAVRNGNAATKLRLGRGNRVSVGCH